MTNTNTLATIPGAALAEQSGALDRNPAAVYLAQLSPRSRRTMRGALEQIAVILSNGKAGALAIEWGALRFQHTAAIRSQLAQAYKASYANLALAALRGVLGAAFRLGQMSAEDYARAKDVQAVRGETLPRGRALTAGEIAALFDACADDATPSGARDAALLALLRLGLRRAEVCGLEIGDFDASKGELVVRGKGNKERTAYLEGGARAALDDWLRVRGGGAGALLLPVTKGGDVECRALKPQAIYNALGKRAQQAGVRDISPHDWRRTFVSDLLDAGADIATVQRMAGHANVTTTARYDRRGEVAKQKATGLLHVPYRARATASA